MRSLIVCLFILLSWLFPALASATSCLNTANSCIDYKIDVTAACGSMQVVSSCPTSNLIGTCASPNYPSPYTFKIYWYVPANPGSSLSTYVDAIAKACTIIAGQSWSTGNATPSSPSLYGLTVANSGAGSGTVTSADGGINCGSTCNASYSSGTSVTLIAAPTSGSTFTGWKGACTGTGTCTVTMNAAMSVTATFSPAPFVVQTTGVTAGIITAPIATVTTTVSFNPADASKLESVYVTAWAPLGTLSAAQQAKIASYTTLVKPLGASTTTFVLVQETSLSGWQPVVNGQLIPYVSGVLGSQAAAVKILDNTSTANLLGSQFCVGYGTNAADMTANGRMQLIATVANSNARSASSGSCNVALPISDARAFAYAESNYASLFAGTPKADQIDFQGNHYDYRYYSTTQNYLAFDPSGVVWVLGPVSGGKVQAVGPLENFRSVITTWEGTQ
jgi:hypothetical protein